MPRQKRSEGLDLEACVRRESRLLQPRGLELRLTERLSSLVASWARRVAFYEQIWTLRRQGCSGEAFARQLGMGRSPVFHDLHAPTFPERKGRSERGRSLLTPYKAYRLRRWNDGCHDALQLCGEIKDHGYPGNDVTVARDAQHLREAQGLAPRQWRGERQTTSSCSCSAMPSMPRLKLAHSLSRCSRH